MAELKILGVKRVEALQEVLEAKYKRKIAYLQLPTEEDIYELVDKEFSLVELRQQYKAAKLEASNVLEALNNVTGKSSKLSVESSYRGGFDTPYKDRFKELCSELRDNPVKALKDECAAKKSSLWLCETLEEARQIVDSV